ncbi:unnamed protein product, partial [Clonostachys byssicola]
MKIAELAAIPVNLTGDFRAAESHLLDLDKHLTRRTYFDGYRLSEIDEKIWVVLASNRATVPFIHKEKLANLTRWFLYVEQPHPEIHQDVKEAQAAVAVKLVAASKAGGSYSLQLQNVDQGVVTRFLPKPSGYLQIRHAKAALLSYYFAHQAYSCSFRLRQDDTNPTKEKEEYQDAIIEDLAWMGIHADKLTYTSDYFQYLFDKCVQLIEDGNAYADDTDQETMRAECMDGIASKRRDRSVEENLRILEEMEVASPEGRQNCIRAKVSVDNPTKAIRDPVIYRVNTAKKHHRTGTDWKIYPMYDLACPIIDNLEGITHALRSTEYTDRNVLYQWFLEKLNLRIVYMHDFSRLSFVRTSLSKRKLAKLVDTGTVTGWNDPRMPTVRGIRRRGMTVSALNDFIIKQGPSQNITAMEWCAILAANKAVIDPIAPRYTAVSRKDLVKVSAIETEGPMEPFIADRLLHPKNKDVGTRKVVFDSEILMDQVDMKLMRTGEEITLIVNMTLELNLSGDSKKTDKKVTWLASKGQKFIPAEAWQFYDIIIKDKLEKEDNFEDFLAPVMATKEDLWCAENISNVKKDAIIQLERGTFYRVDKGLADWVD